MLYRLCRFGILSIVSLPATSSFQPAIPYTFQVSSLSYSYTSVQIVVSTYSTCDSHLSVKCAYTLVELQLQQPAASAQWPTKCMLAVV